MNDTSFSLLPKVDLKFDKAVEAKLEWDPMFTSQAIIQKCQDLTKLSVILDQEKVEAYDAFKNLFKRLPLEFSGEKSRTIFFSFFFGINKYCFV